MPGPCPRLARVRTLVCAVVLLLVLAQTRESHAQACGPFVNGRYGGEVTAVEILSPTHILMGRGLYVELVNVSDPAAPFVVRPNPGPQGTGRIGVAAPVRKISSTPGSNFAFALLENGDVAYLQIVRSLTTGTPNALAFLGTLPRAGIQIVDVQADGARVYCLHTDSNPTWGLSYLRIYDVSSGAANFMSSFSPLNSRYSYDRLTLVGNVLWIAFSERDSSILGVDGVNISNPALPTRTAAALTNAPLGATTTVRAVVASGTTLFVAYGALNPWQTEIRSVNVAVPTNPAWTSPWILTGVVEEMAVTGSRLHIARQEDPVAVYNTANPAAPTLLTQYTILHGRGDSIRSAPTLDFLADGNAGLLIRDTSAMPSTSLRGILSHIPSTPVAVRRHNNITAVLDVLNTRLELYDLSLPEAQRFLGLVPMPSRGWSMNLLEIAVLPSGVYACVATETQIYMVNITNPASPAIVGTFTPPRPISEMAVSGSRLYASDSQGLIFVDLTAPSSPVLRGTLPLGGTNGNTIMDLEAWGTTLAMASNTLGLWIIDATNPSSPQTRAVLSPIANYQARYLAKGGDYLYALGGREPLIDDRLDVYNVAAPFSPVRVWTVGGPGNSLPVADAHTLAFVAAPTGERFLVGARSSPAGGIGSLSVYDLTHPSAPTLIATREIWAGGTSQIVSGLAPVPAGAPGGGGGGAGSVLQAANRGGLAQHALPTQWAPAFYIAPTTEVCRATVVLSAAPDPLTGLPVVSASPAAVTYRWHRAGTPLSDGPTPWGSIISGSATPTLTITNARRDDSAFTPTAYRPYVLVATNTCGDSGSPTIEPTVCPGDFDCSGDINTSDITAFLAAWFSDRASGAATADFNGSGATDTADITAFLSHWFSDRAWSLC